MPAVQPVPAKLDPVAGEAAEPEPEPTSPIPLDIVHVAGAWDEAHAVPLARSAAAALVAELATASGAACIALSSDAEIAGLNGTYRGKPKPTNVLSFPAGPGAADGDAPFLGDIVLAQETIDREAAERGVPFDHHLQHLVVHGLLHLLGFDHETEEEARAMEALEVRVLARLGIADPYAGEEDTP
jgi:probable rRNA maturation factor